MRTQEAFTISILECARKINFKFNRTWINWEGLTEHIFHCPLRKDKNASICSFSHFVIFNHHA
jgi:hypothetical protein